MHCSTVLLLTLGNAIEMLSSRFLQQIIVFGITSQGHGSGVSHSHQQKGYSISCSGTTFHLSIESFTVVQNFIIGQYSRQKLGGLYKVDLVMRLNNHELITLDQY